MHAELALNAEDCEPEDDSYVFLEDIANFTTGNANSPNFNNSTKFHSDSSVLVDEIPKIVVKVDSNLLNADNDIKFTTPTAEAISVIGHVATVDNVAKPIANEVVEVKKGSKKSQQTFKKGKKSSAKSEEDGYIEMSIKELREVASRVISGDITKDELNLNVKGEVGELLRLIVDTKSKVDDITPTLKASKDTLPELKKALNEVTLSTDNASIDIIKASEDMCDYYKALANDIDSLLSVIDTADRELFIDAFNKVEAKLNEASVLGLKILEALEYQDITEQKVRKVIKAMNDIGSRLGTIVGYLHIQKSEGKSAKEMEKLLSDYGLS